jgi:hypothetical protein
VLKALGARNTRYAKDGAEALNIANLFPIDITLIDGIEFTEFIRPHSVPSHHHDDGAFKASQDD